MRSDTAWKQRLASLLLLTLVRATSASADAGARAPAFACSAQARVDPPRAYVGEPVLYRVRILRGERVRRVTWLRRPRFESVRVEHLPGRLPDPKIHGIGRGGILAEERVVLFPLRPGRLRIGEATLRCVGEDETWREVKLAAQWIEAERLPRKGRPSDFGGVVGPVRVEASLRPRRIPLGSSARLVVSIRGRGSVWNARSPLDPHRLPSDLELFASPPELTRLRGEELVSVLRFSYDLVPHHAGALEIPLAAIPYFDPESRSYRRADTPPLRLEVGAALPND